MRQGEDNMAGKLVTLFEGDFKVTPVTEIHAGKYSYKLSVRQTVGFKKLTGTWYILSSRSTPGGTQTTFQQLNDGKIHYADERGFKTLCGLDVHDVGVGFTPQQVTCKSCKKIKGR